MKRTLGDFLQTGLSEKIVLLTGARQCGKTTLAKALTDNFDYLNFDAAEDRVLLQQKSWDRHKSVIIFDELHKMKGWKRWLKGVYDKEGISPALLVTGSAKLDTYRRVGDSLAGRYFQYRLYPLDLKEIAQNSALTHQAALNTFEQLMRCSGFPEPFLKGSENYYKRWRRGHTNIILRQDLIDLHVVRDIQTIEMLVELLRTRVGGLVSYANLAQTLGRDINTIKRWIILLENLYIIFRITPYSKNIARSLLKEPKYYFFDIGQVTDPGARLENLVALSLLKELHFIQDTQGYDVALHFLRTKDGKELDFAIAVENKITHILEVKSSDNTLSPMFNYFRQYFPNSKLIQLVKNCTREKTFPNGCEIRNLITWLQQLDLN